MCSNTVIKACVYCFQIVFLVLTTLLCTINYIMSEYNETEYELIEEEEEQEEDLFAK